MTSVSPDLSKAPGRWLSRELIAWPSSALPDGLDPSSLEWRLHWSPTGGLDPWASEPVPWHTAPLRAVASSVTTRSRGLAGAVLLDVPARVPVGDAVRGQVAVTAHQRSGRLVNAGGLQLAGVLDDVFADAVHARLGVSVAGGVPTLRVWAPTAQSLSVLLWEPGRALDSEPLEVPATREPDGCWSTTGAASWLGGHYLYAVTVYVAAFGRVVTNRVTDPYSVALTQNSTLSMVVDLADPALAPELWATAGQPRIDSPVDQVIYELHVRDFSSADQTLPPDVRGTYLAFAEDGLGARHLRRLAQAGLNTVQLLPAFDFASSDENRTRWPVLDRDHLLSLPPDADAQQRYIRENTVHRAFNWGYDPWHYMVPEGSYATPDAVDGGARIHQARTMVGALHAMGLRVVLDQVYNHTMAHGQAPSSVLDRLVPNYYHRLDPAGQVYTSTCCPNVATEHLMAEKLMVDSCVLWAKHYKVDGFRFDLMGFHSRANMLRVRSALDALTLERDGVDGRQVTMYGEGWTFGEVAGNALFVQASQGQLGGTSIATFSDRLRDAVRGGSPFDADPRLQGFGSGLCTSPNSSTGNGSSYDQRDRLLHCGDLIQVGLAGTLRDFTFVSQRYAKRVRGDQVDYGGSAAGYADAPDEALNYVDAHDNETLFDALALKLPISTPMAGRVRANTVCLALATLGQNPVLWHAGTDILRSKSLDRNSYDSGDWFNYLDFSMTDNGFGAGLPPASDNRDKWPYLRPLLALPDLRPTPADIRTAHAQALDLLRLRASSRLFRLGDAAAIHSKVSFPISGTWAQVPGVILMLLDDTVGSAVDEHFARIAVVFNATAWPARQLAPRLAGPSWRLHPVQQQGADDLVRQSTLDRDAFVVPGRTVAVFVEPR